MVYGSRATPVAVAQRFQGGVWSWRHKLALETDSSGLDVLFVGPLVQDRADRVEAVPQVVVARVEMRRQADTRPRPVIDQDLATDQLAGHGLALGDVQDQHAAALCGVLGGMRLEAA